MTKYQESIMKAIFFVAASTSILAVILICLFLFVNGIPAMAKIGFF
ncbi:MAG TPA: phosphate ABC transporter permease subunit PstC, partial [Firmicutes bacterium]|nr:phosphate ABC transporter permease subunit PstC [Bacillota bacterium]